MPEFTPLPEGSLAILTADAPEGWGGLKKGTVFEIEMVEDALEPGDHGYGQEGVYQGPSYLGSHNGGLNNVNVPVDIVAAYAGKALPVRADVISDISSALHHGSEDGYRVHRTSVDGDEITVDARSDAGIEFSFTLTVGAFRRL